MNCPPWICTQSDIVVADLTTGNPNVFFELGIRHAFRKSGTVHMVAADQALPFDIRAYRAIEYSTELADIPEVIKAIEDAIAKRLNQPDRADNPVHDALPELPLDIRATADHAFRGQLRTAQENVDRLRLENEKLAAKLAEYRPAALEGDSIDIDAVLDKADEVMKSRGQHAILLLRQAMNEGGASQFVQQLRRVLKSPYLNENDFMEIVTTCKTGGLDEHRRATLEVARKRFPYDEKIFGPSGICVGGAAPVTALASRARSLRGSPASTVPGAREAAGWRRAAWAS